MRKARSYARERFQAEDFMLQWLGMWVAHVFFVSGRLKTGRSLLTPTDAAGLLGMALVIQFLVYPGHFPEHPTWMAALLAILVLGAGHVSLDHLVQCFWSNASGPTSEGGLRRHTGKLARLFVLFAGFFR